MKKIVLILFCTIFVLQNTVCAQETNNVSVLFDFNNKTDMNTLEFDEAENFTKGIATHPAVSDGVLKLSRSGDNGKYYGIKYCVSETGITDEVLRISIRANMESKVSFTLSVDDKVSVYVLRYGHESGGFFAKDKDNISHQLGEIKNYYPCIDKFALLTFEYDLKNGYLRAFVDRKETYACKDGQYIETGIKSIKNIKIAMRTLDIEEHSLYLDNLEIIQLCKNINQNVLEELSETIDDSLRLKLVSVIDSVSYYKAMGYSFQNEDELYAMLDSFDEIPLKKTFSTDDDLQCFKFDDGIDFSANIADQADAADGKVLCFSKRTDEAIYHGLHYAVYANHVTDNVVRVGFRAKKDSDTSMVLDINGKTVVYILRNNHPSGGFFAKDKDNISYQLGETKNYYPCTNKFADLSFEFDLQKGFLRVFEDSRESYACQNGAYIETGITEIKDVKIGMRALDDEKYYNLYLDNFSIEREKKYSEILSYPKYQTRTSIYLSCINAEGELYLNYTLGSVYADERYTIFDGDTKKFEIVSNDNVVIVSSVVGLKNSYNIKNKSSVVFLPDTAKVYRYRIYNYIFDDKKISLSIDKKCCGTENSITYVSDNNKSNIEFAGGEDTKYSAGVYVPINIIKGGYCEIEVIANPVTNCELYGYENVLEDAMPVKIAAAIADRHRVNVDIASNAEKLDYTCILSAETDDGMKYYAKKGVSAESNVEFEVEGNVINAKVFVWNDIENMKPLSMPYYMRNFMK